eukprot:scaffold95684_cov69-Phaeocystis_antarctica.AAC.2
MERPERRDHVRDLRRRRAHSMHFALRQLEQILNAVCCRVAADGGGESVGVDVAYAILRERPCAEGRRASYDRVQRCLQSGGCVSLAAVEDDQLRLAFKVGLGGDLVDNGLIRHRGVVVAHKINRAAVPAEAEDKAIVSRPHLARQHLPEPLEHR